MEDVQGLLEGRAAVVGQLGVVKIGVFANCIIASALARRQKGGLRLSLFTSFQVTICQVVVGALRHIITAAADFVEALDGFLVATCLVQYKAEFVVVVIAELAAKALVLLQVFSALYPILLLVIPLTDKLSYFRSTALHRLGQQHLSDAQQFIYISCFVVDLAQVVRYDPAKFIIANECFKLSNRGGILFCLIGNVAIVVFVMGLVFPGVGGSLEEYVSGLFNIVLHQVAVSELEVVFALERIWNICRIYGTQPLHHLAVTTVIEVIVGRTDMGLLPSWTKRIGISKIHQKVFAVLVHQVQCAHSSVIAAFFLEKALEPQICRKDYVKAHARRGI